MANYEIIVRNKDDGTENKVGEDSVAEGEIDEWSLIIKNPKITTSGSKTSGN